MSKTITIKGGVYLDSRDSHTEGGRFVFFTGEAKSWDAYVLVTPHELVFDIPDGFDPRGDLVKALEEQKRKLQAEFTARVTEINAQIGKLLAITNEVQA